MASLQKLTISVILISLVLCFFSSRSVNAVEDFIAQACSSKECNDILRSDKQITAAATKELDLGLAIMKLIIAQTKTTHDYILKKTAENPAYADCEKLWLDMGPGFMRILDTTTKNKGYKEDTDDYDFHDIGEAVGRCNSMLEEKKIVDPEIKKGGNIVLTLMATANNALTHQKLTRKGQN
ncbi:hypothetical protein RND71_026823 [Anisodus tanguticus]|uniref:Pectinesterase inhibitor domain-containing protein n=1 Tax=Anisodus tanguticus TaxID=243964 RepID=A0AAE1RLK2_9SOLA|nr:hypothetical protein RND71_026823 [Anisodus tanguticus]